MNPKYLRQGFAFALAHAVEEAGEFLAAAGKTLRWGKESVNPELPEAEQETNGVWLGRELADLQGALGRLGVAMVEHDGRTWSGSATPWSTEVELTEAGTVRINVMLSTDSGPMRMFRPFLDVDLDEAHASELLGKLAMALKMLRGSREVQPS
jgi:hypothetical protein